MKPSDKQLKAVRDQIAVACGARGLSSAEIGRIARVHPSQVGRICGGDFKTFSHNVVQICRALGIRVPHSEARSVVEDPAWIRAQSSMQRIWDETPEGARAIARMLDAIAELRLSRGEGATEPAES